MPLIRLSWIRLILLPEHAQVLADAPIQANEQRVADERMTDGHFLEMRQCSEENQVVKVEVVSGIDAETKRMGELCRGRVATKAVLRLGRAALERAREGLGIELDAISPDVLRPSDRRLVGFHEQADPDAQRAHLPDHRGDRLMWCVRRPAGLARDLARLDRNNRALRGPQLANECQEIGPRVPFDIELGPAVKFVQQCRDVMNVTLGDVPGVGPGMHCHPWCSRFNTDAGRVEHRRQMAPARIAERRDLIDVDGKLDHVVYTAAPTCCLTASMSSWPHARISRSSWPSSMTRSRGSVPEYRTSRRPLPASRDSTRSMTAATSGIVFKSTFWCTRRFMST